MDNSETRPCQELFTLQDVRPAALQILREQLRPLRKRLGRRRYRQVSDVHDARVEIRRARATLELLGPLLKAGPARRLDRRLRKMGRRLGPVRDLDVILERSLGWQLKRRGDAQVEFLHRLADLRSELAAAAVRELSEGVERSDIHARRRMLAPAAVSGGSWRQALEADIQAALLSLAEPLVNVDFRPGLEVVTHRALERWHRKRKLCRRLRYQLESLGAVADFGTAIEFLRGAQVRFGEVQDAAFAQQRIQGDLGRLMSRRLRIAVLELEQSVLRTALSEARAWWLGPPGWEQTANVIAAALQTPLRIGGSRSA